MSASNLPPPGEDAGPVPPRWPWVVGTVLSVAGFCVAAYLTYEHYTSSTSLSCPAGGGIVNCLKVTTSSYSMIHGVPVAVLGLIFFAVMIPLQLPRAWASHWQVLRMGRLGWSIVGVATAVWLVYAELFKIDAICLWCTTVHGLTVLLFISTAFATASTGAAFLEEDFDDGFEDSEEYLEDSREDEPSAPVAPAGGIAESGRQESPTGGPPVG